jgi:hypothetical protein
MVPKGIQNAGAVRRICEDVLDRLDPTADPRWKEILSDIAKALDQLESKFYLKTNLAVPVTNACRKSAEELADLTGSGGMDRFPEVLEQLKANVEKLLKGANMEGIIIT